MEANEKRDQLVEAYNTSVDELHSRIDAFENLASDDEETETAARDAVTSATTEADEAQRRLDDFDADQKARAAHSKIAVAIEGDGSKDLDIRVTEEPDMYRSRSERSKDDPSFLYDMFRSQIMHDPMASQRIANHQAYEMEQRAMTSTTFGGLIPPQYLVGMYAKALRNGRVFCDQVSAEDLPEIGMNLIIPRLTTGTAAAPQSSENTDVTTQDMVETDLTVPVNTIAGYIPVSRQGLERAQYNEEILFEDLVARYWADLDTQALNGNGTPPNLLGLIQTVGIKTSAATGSSNLPAVYANIADVIQQINTAVGGLGYMADKIVMHPRRWGSFVAAVDTTDRPILGISGVPAFNIEGQGLSAGYGFVGNIQGLPVYLDANIPTNLGGGANEDTIVIFASGLVHLWERTGDPVTLAFEQQAGTALSVRLIVYGYVAFTAGRYPAACGIVTGLDPPTFGS